MDLLDDFAFSAGLHENKKERLNAKITKCNFILQRKVKFKN
jgi:hypothetical protein